MVRTPFYQVSYFEKLNMQYLRGFRRSSFTAFHHTGVHMLHRNRPCQCKDSYFNLTPLNQYRSGLQRLYLGREMPSLKRENHILVHFSIIV